jgi:hypothetical protein
MFISLINSSAITFRITTVSRVCQIKFFYVFILPGTILRHLGEFGKIRLLLGEIIRFFAGGWSVWVSKSGAMTDFQFFLYRI